MKQSINIFLVLILIVLSNACTKENSFEEKAIRPVKYQVVAYGDNEKKRSFSGTAETEKVIDLSLRSAGVITQLNIKLGQKVRKGQLLARLENVQTQLAYEQTLARQNSAESQLMTAKSALRRTRELFEKGSASLSDFEQAKNNFRTIQQNFEGAKRAVAIQKEQIRFGSLYAPSTGVIANLNVEINENIASGQTIASLNVGERMEVNLGIPESIINSIQLGDSVSVVFPSLPGHKYQGTVHEISPALSQNMATYPIKVALDQTHKEVKSGMSAKVAFDLSQNSNTSPSIIVPTHAIGEDESSRFVYLIEESGADIVVKRQTVELGNLTTAGFEVKSGITTGQLIATAGLQSLWDGQLVRLMNPE